MKYFSYISNINVESINKMNLKKLISNKSHWTINKHLAKEIGLESTLILQHLIDWSTYHNKETIFQTYEQIQSELGLSEYAVKKVCIPNLKKLGFISITRKGMGYKNHYTVHNDVIVDFLSNPTSQVEIDPSSEVRSKSPTSQVENNLSSQVENTSAISKNIVNNNLDSKNIDKDLDNTSTGRTHMDTSFSQSPYSSQEINSLDEIIN